MDLPTGGAFSLLRFLFKPIIDFFDMLFFYRAYEVSTLHYIHREIFHVSPSKLTDDLECKILWKPYHLRKKLVTPMIWLKAIDDANFSKVVLIVTAYNSKIKYQDQVTLYKVDCIPTQSALPSIPFRKLQFENNMVYTPYDRIKIEVIELSDSEGKEVDVFHSGGKYIKPSDRLEVAMGLQKGDVEKWGEVFNLEFIEVEIRQERRKLIGSRLHSLKPIYHLKTKLFSFDWVVKVVFWSKNIIFAKKLTLEYIQYLERQKEYQIWKENIRKSDAA